MKPVPPLQESELPEPAPRAPKSKPVKPVKPVSSAETIRETSRRVSPSRASAKPVERHDQRRQPKRGRHKEG